MSIFVYVLCNYIPIKRHITRAKNFLKDYFEEIAPISTQKFWFEDEDDYDYVYSDNYFYIEYGAW